MSKLDKFLAALTKVEFDLAQLRAKLERLGGEVPPPVRECRTCRYRDRTERMSPCCHCKALDPFAHEDMWEAP